MTPHSGPGMTQASDPLVVTIAEEMSRCLGGPRETLEYIASRPSFDRAVRDRYRRLGGDLSDPSRDPAGAVRDHLASRSPW